ncbi:MAG: methyltransferase domain-containing protein [Planctomycetota bacterium]
MRILVALANYGVKNRKFLDKLLAAYRSMPHEVHIVVLSDRPKDDLGDDVEVLVGTPTEDPWSLPFAHRPLFRDRIEDYDLFIYSEDDTLLTPENLEAWLQVQPLLPADRIAGFLRYEVFQDGSLSYCGVHYHYHFDPKTVEVHGGEVFVSFTNEHSALYILTRDQLRRCLESGGFDMLPHQGRYDMLVSAASDPYTQCGLQRRICVSRSRDFLLKHLPNVYLDRIGVPERFIQPQLDAILRIAAGQESRDELFDPKVRVDVHREAWNKDYHPVQEPRYLPLVAQPGQRVLAVGVGSGLLEMPWLEAGAKVTVIPMDSIVAAGLKARGFEVLAPNLERAIAELNGRRFERIVLHHILEHVAEPVAWLRRLAELLEPGGRLLVTSANQTGRALRMRKRREPYPLRRGMPFAESHYHYTTAKIVAGWIQAAGLVPGRPHFLLRNKAQRLARYGLGLLDSRLADAFLFEAHRA